MNPKITIVTVVRNAESTIEQTMLSVLHQTYSNIEYIIVDGASTDGTLQIIKNYESRIMNGEFPNIVSFKFISEPDKGIYDAMNKGIDMATGEWMLFLNSGDRLATEKIFSQLFEEKQYKNVDVVYGNIILEYSFGRYYQKPLPIENITKMMVTPHPATFIRTNILQFYKFDTKFKIVADYDLMRRLYADNKKFQHVDCIVSVFEAETGISATAHLLHYKELALLNDTYGTLKYKKQIFIIHIKHLIKKFVPKFILKKRREKYLIKENILNFKL